MSSHQLVDDGDFGGKLLFVHVEGLVRRGHCRIVRIGVIADGHAPSLSAELAVDAYLPSGWCVADEVGQQVVEDKLHLLGVDPDVGTGGLVVILQCNVPLGSQWGEQVGVESDQPVQWVQVDGKSLFLLLGLLFDVYQVACQLVDAFGIVADHVQQALSPGSQGLMFGNIVDGCLDEGEGSLQVMCIPGEDGEFLRRFFPIDSQLEYLPADADEESHGQQVDDGGPSCVPERWFDDDFQLLFVQYPVILACDVLYVQGVFSWPQVTELQPTVPWGSGPIVILSVQFPFEVGVAGVVVVDGCQAQCQCVVRVWQSQGVE